MATNSIVLPIDIRKNRQALSKVYGHYFPVVHNSGALSTVGLAKHMADHGSITNGIHAAKGTTFLAVTALAELNLPVS